MTKIEQARKILKELGLPAPQQNEMSALTLLALCGLKKATPWRESTRERCGVSNEIMAFVNENYKTKKTQYAPNTRETFRRQVLHQFVQAGIALYNPDEPDLPINSPKAHYRLSPEVLSVIKSYGTDEWDEKLQEFKDTVGTLKEKYAKEREMKKIPLVINGKEFAEMFVPGGVLLYVGDTEDKDLYRDDAALNELNLYITEHSKLPDIIICDKEKGWLFLIEVVTSHGPISPKRLIELEEFTQGCPYGKVYVTAFPDAKEFRQFAADIAWETEVWLADTPEHMIHFNGDRFIGPRQ